MERNIKIEAITLKKIQIGESNIGLSLLTEKNEVLFVMAFRAAKTKNKLFPGTNPFVVAQWDLYYDPVKDYWRAKEVSVIDFNESLQLSLENFYTASFMTEIILKSQGTEDTFPLIIEALKILTISKKRVEVLIQFLLRFLLKQGVLPEFIFCHKCERAISRESLYYIGEDELVCMNCLKQNNYLELNPGICLYCEKTPIMFMEKAITIGLEESSLLKLKKYLILLIQKHTEGKLLTLNSSDGLI